ncbi:MAG: primosomal protein N' [Pseudomonadota bacterium]
MGQTSHQQPRITVAVRAPWTSLLTYTVPTAAPPLGTIVQVPLGKTQTVGIVWDTPAQKNAPQKDSPQKSPLQESSPQEDKINLREIGAMLDIPPVSAGFRRFLAQASDWTMTPLGGIIGAVLPRDVWARPPKHPRQRKKPDDEAVIPPSPQAVHTLTPAQRAGVATLAAAARAKTYRAFALTGAPGAGKTDVYFGALAACLAQGQQGLVLMPEISLTSQWIDRFTAHFGFAPCVWHSSLTPAKRREAFRASTTGEAAVIIGARSALFLPLARPGLIIVDEEHDSAYKQEDTMTYHARDLAVARALGENIPVILTSATPSIETVVNLRQGRYHAVHLPSRPLGRAPPKLHIIDQRPHRGAIISPPLRAAIDRAIGAGTQALLFINRRGYAPVTLCQACGHRLECQRCDARLIHHKAEGQLRCHLCGYHCPLPLACPSCGTSGDLIPYGLGVERVAAAARQMFPSARLMALSSDLLSARNETLKAITDGQVDLIIGTQLLAKGHNFPLLAVVGIIDGDAGLDTADFRGMERAFQLLGQVAGRAGRNETIGHAFVQTYQPDHPVIRALVSDAPKAFIDQQITEREKAGLPPFARLATITIAGRQEGPVRTFCEKLVRTKPAAKGMNKGIKVFGPAPTPRTRIGGWIRWRFLLQTARQGRLQPYIRQWLPPRPPAQLRLRVDIDPYSFL